MKQFLIFFSAIAMWSSCAAAQQPESKSTSPAPAHPMTASQNAACDAPVYHVLDFWIGKWDVFSSTDGSKAGTSVLEKTLKGCVIEVYWTEADGSGNVKEIFYYDRPLKQWTQLWLGDTGRTKQRHLLEQLKGGGVRFMGTVPHPDGGSHLDRSTVTPLPGDRIHQVIEASLDGGKTWQVGFDAEYRRGR